MKLTPGRRGVASVVGTIFFVVVFMLALGSMAYVSSLQSQSSQAEMQAQSLAARRGAESLEFSGGASGLSAINDGPSTLSVQYVVLRFPNGTVYPLVASASLPTGGRLGVQSLIPQEVCAPGSATCLSKYNQIVNGNPPGSTLGVVTSLGNSFWYAYAGSQAQPSTLVSWVKTGVSTNGLRQYSSTTLSISLSPGTTYAFAAYTAIEPSFGTEYYNFEVHTLPAGASLVIACTPMSYPQGGGNQPTNCVTATGTPIAAVTGFGFGVSPPVFQTPGVFGLVKVGSTGGTLQLDFACTANCGSVMMRAGSYMVAEPVG